jgi:hypothetical protein
MRPRRHTECYCALVRLLQFVYDKVPTRNNIASVHFVFILDEAEAVHELDLLDGTATMLGEVILHFGLGCYSNPGQHGGKC